MRREGEDDSSSERRMVSVGDIPCPLVDSVMVPVVETESEMMKLRLRGVKSVYEKKKAE
jgi:hypothetical protein